METDKKNLLEELKKYLRSSDEDNNVIFGHKFDASNIPFSSLVQTVLEAADSMLKEYAADDSDEDSEEDKKSDETVEDVVKEDSSEENPVKSEESSIAQILRDEVMNLPMTEDEIVDKLVDYVIDCVSDKVNKPYKLHRKDNVPAAEVYIPEYIIDTYQNLNNSYITEKVRDVLKIRTGVKDVVFSRSNSDDETYSAYLIL